MFSQKLSPTVPLIYTYQGGIIFFHFDKHKVFHCGTIKLE